MKERIARESWTLTFDVTEKKFSPRDKILMWIENIPDGG
jgi:hypothetical protein